MLTRAENLRMSETFRIGLKSPLTLSALNPCHPPPKPRILTLATHGTQL